VIDISFCRREEIPALVDFIRLDWKRDHVFVRNPAFLEWHYDARRFRAAPEGGLSFLLARDGDQLVGMLGLNELGFTLYGEPGHAVWASLWYAKPEYRRHAIGARLWQRVVGGDYTAICMIGMNPSVRPIFESLGYELLVDTPRWVRALDARAMRELLSENPAPEADAEGVRALVEACAAAAPDALPGVGELELADWDAAASAAWDRAWAKLAPTLVGSVKSSEYIAWRYADHPIFRYRVRVGWQRGEAVALVVTRLELPRERSERILRVVEALGEPAAVAAVLAGELAWARDEKAVFADFHAVSERFARPLEALGFRRLDPEREGALVPHRFQPLQFGRIPFTSAYHLTGPKRERLAALLDCGDFHVSRADGDQDRPN
jgi:hypothetical protein